MRAWDGFTECRDRNGADLDSILRGRTLCFRLPARRTFGAQTVIKGSEPDIVTEGYSQQMVDSHQAGVETFIATFL